MNRYKVILWDIDGTLLDFEAVERIAMQKCFSTFCLGDCTEELLKCYVPINKKYWTALERGEVTKQTVLVGRFQEFFQVIGIQDCDAEAFNDEYQRQLSSHFIFHDLGYEVVAALKQRGYQQYAATNGTKLAQEGKLHISGLDLLFNGIFISEIIGVEKPMHGFFDAVFKAMPDIRPNEMLIVGDSLTSDIKGGNLSGLDTCWYNPKKLCNTTKLKIDYEIENLQELLKIL